MTIPNRMPTAFCRHPLLAPALLVALTAALATAPNASAQAGEPRIEITVGSFTPTFDTSLRLDSVELGGGTQLELERDFLLEESPREIWAEVGIRIGRRHRLVIDRTGFDRAGSNTFTRSIQFGDVVYAADADLAARIESRHTNVAWRFSVLRSSQADVAVSIGASWIDLEASVSGIATATAGSLPAGGVEIEERGEASGAVPLAGLHGSWWLTRRVRFGADWRYFDVTDFEGWTGSIVELGGRLDWFFSRNLALGIGYSSTTIEAEFESSADLGAVDYSFDGPRASLTLAF